MPPQSTFQVLVDIESQLTGLEGRIFAFEHLDDNGDDELQKFKDIHQMLENMYNHVHKIMNSDGTGSIYAHIVLLF